MVPIISAYRRIVIDGRPPEMVGFMTSLAVAIVLVVTGWASYRALEGRFAERV